MGGKIRYASALFVGTAALALSGPATAAKPSSPTYKVPGKIRSDCSVAVDDKLTAWARDGAGWQHRRIRLEWLLRAERHDHLDGAQPARAGWSRVGVASAHARGQPPGELALRRGQRLDHPEHRRARQ